MASVSVQEVKKKQEPLSSDYVFIWFIILVFASKENCTLSERRSETLIIAHFFLHYIRYIMIQTMIKLL